MVSGLAFQPEWMADERSGLSPFVINSTLLIMERKIVLSAVAGFVTMFLSSWLLFGILLKAQMEKWQAAVGDCGNLEPDFPAMIIAQVAMCILLAILLTRLNKETFMSGCITAGWITLLIVIWYDGWMWATFPFMDLEMAAFDVIGNTIIGALTGGVIGWVGSRLD